MAVNSLELSNLLVWNCWQHPFLFSFLNEHKIGTGTIFHLMLIVMYLFFVLNSNLHCRISTGFRSSLSSQISPAPPQVTCPLISNFWLEQDRWRGHWLCVLCLVKWLVVWLSMSFWVKAVFPLLRDRALFVFLTLSILLWAPGEGVRKKWKCCVCEHIFSCCASPHCVCDRLLTHCCRSIYSLPKVKPCLGLLRHYHPQSWFSLVLWSQISGWLKNTSWIMQLFLFSRTSSALLLLSPFWVKVEYQPSSLPNDSTWLLLGPHWVQGLWRLKKKWRGRAF